MRHDPARLPDAGALRPEVHRRRQRRAPAGGHPPRHLRQLRAVHRAAHRALRRRVPAVAGAGAGDASCRLPTGTPRYAAGGARRGCRPRGCGSRLDARQEKIGYKIREAQLQKVPYMLVVGDREAADGTVSVRSRSGGDLGSRGRSTRFVADALAEVAEKRSSMKPARRREAVIAFEPRGMRGPRRDDRVRINERIRVREIRVIDETGQQLGIMPPPQALRSRDPKASTSWRSRRPPCRRSAGSSTTGVSVPTSRSARAGQEAPEDHRGQGNQVPAEGRRARLPVQEEAHRALPRGRRQGQGHGVLPRTRDGAPGDRPPDPDRLIEELSEVALPETMPRQEGNQMHTILCAAASAGASPPARARGSAETEEAARRQPAPRQEARRHAEDEAEESPRCRQAVQETGTGKFRRAAAFKRHQLTNKTTQMKRHARGSGWSPVRAASSCGGCSGKFRRGARSSGTPEQQDHEYRPAATGDRVPSRPDQEPEPSPGR